MTRLKREEVNFWRAFVRAVDEQIMGLFLLGRLGFNIEAMHLSIRHPRVKNSMIVIE